MRSAVTTAESSTSAPPGYSLGLLAKLVYHRICLTQIQIFRFIEFCFVFCGRGIASFESPQATVGAQPHSREAYETALSAGESDAAFCPGFSARLVVGRAALRSGEEPVKTIGELKLPGRSRGLQGLARATTLQSMGAADCGAAEWRPINAGKFRRALLLVRQSQARR